MKFIFATVVLILLSGAIAYGSISSKIPRPTVPPSNTNQTSVFLTTQDFFLKEIASNLHIPWSIIFTAENRILVSERNGYIRVILNQSLTEKPLFYFEEVAFDGEGGLMGLAPHPDYDNNHFIYAMLTYWKNGDAWIKIERLIDQYDSLQRDKIIIDNIHAGFIHNGGRIHFGPDKKLYIVTGDAGKRELAQDQAVLEGKFLRLNDDGSVPDDNPFPGSPVYTLGHRNSQGFDWHPVSQHLFATEHGPSGFDGPEGGDEINYILAGHNYGWPLVSHQNTAPGISNPLATFTPAVAPSGAIFYDKELFPKLKNHFLIAELRGSALLEVIIDDADNPTITSMQPVPGINIGRIRDVAVSPSGIVYLASNNTDGRGQPNPGDDKVFAIMPK